MKMKLFLSIGLCLICLNVFSQNIKTDLIGKWEFQKTIDKNENEIKEVKRGENIVKANGPDIIINEDGTYSKKFTEENIDKGNWKLVSENEIQFEMVIPKNSRQGKLIVFTQKLINKKWRKDNKGNFLDVSNDIVISINESEMRLVYEKEYIQLFRKIVE
ncbi:hypothetical protein ACXGQW_00715 [Wenyingzhuangia sp. IMCC45533]